jgi:membrane-associated phospholipid phosphatase
MKSDEIVMRANSNHRGAGLRTFWIFALVLLLFSDTAIMSQSTRSESADTAASSPVPTQAAVTEPGSATLKSLPRNLIIDQENLLTTPFHLNKSQWKWAVPLALVGTVLLASDTAVEGHAPSNPNTISRATTASNAGLAALVGAGGGMFLWGHLAHNDQQRETGLLSGEAAIDAALDTEIIKYAAGRERPFVGDGRGRFFQGGDSFPSFHASASFAVASVIAHEYSGPLTQVLAYGVAGAVDAARFGGRKHFMTDLVVGSALGWYLGRQVYRTHSRYSDAEIARFGTFNKGESDGVRDPADMGSSFVSLDSWIYPALERLQSLGYIQSGFLGMRPWTRMECARLLEEANLRLRDAEPTEDTERAQEVYADLAEEFADETGRINGASNIGVAVDSIYTRFTQISGLPLRDGLHFGQTIINDYGRPYGRGFNSVSGFTSHAEAGPFSFYVRGEYQHAASLPSLSAEARQVIGNVDALPTPPAIATSTVNQFDLLEGYVGLQLSNWQITFGKQALWWGEDASGPMLMSNNAAPIVMLQINRASPFRLPSVLKVLGPMRTSYFLGRLDGHHWLVGESSGLIGSWTQSLNNQPFIIGEKLSLKPSDNLEIGFSVTSLSGGTGVPFTLHKIVQASFLTGNAAPGTPNDPGDRRGAFDFAYRIPKLRNWLTIYGDAFTDDQANPWLAWNKAAVTSGFYLSHFPKIPKLDLRAEAVYTDPPAGTPIQQHGFFYINSRFKSGYTNDGTLIGSWIGRQGQGTSAWMNYWFTPKNTLQLSFRHQTVSQKFIPNGGSLSDFGVSSDVSIRSNFGIRTSVQYERWLLPVIQPGISRNVTASVEFLFAPGKLLRRSATSAGRNNP